MSKEAEDAPPVLKPLSLPPRLLLGPGPSNAHPRVLAGLGMPLIGHLDPAFLKMMEEVKALLRWLWGTSNDFTLPISGTGSAAMEATLANLVEPGDRVLVCINGYFGGRLVDMAERYGADVHTIKRPWGEVFTLEELTAAVEEVKPAIVAVVHAETSTGACQPLEGWGDVVHSAGGLLLIDSVTSLGGVPLHLDALGVDAAYSGAQKCLGCPPGASPLTMSARAMDKLLSREGKVKNWYLDLTLIARYLAVPTGAKRAYHHTAPVSNMAGLREALAVIAAEGKEAVWARHADTAAFMHEQMASIGLELALPKEIALPSLIAVRIPEGVDGGAVVRHLREQYNIEIGGGLGELAGKIWRIGMMGYNSRRENVLLVIAALRDALLQQGYECPADKARL
eukprot:PLAT14373.1.p1 GENE.PLAT14373.1~~PLAT14373.1.p1  ORF type:complete len:396 (+),score=160.19 PLAT14373.1:18-1205(+)